MRPAPSLPTVELPRHGHEIHAALSFPLTLSRLFYLSSLPAFPRILYLFYLSFSLFVLLFNDASRFISTRSRSPRAGMKNVLPSAVCLIPLPAPFRVGRGTHRGAYPRPHLTKKQPQPEGAAAFLTAFCLFYFAMPSCTATATATVAPTMGLLPMPMSPIISTCAGTEEEPANCASECILPIVSVMP